MSNMISINNDPDISSALLELLEPESQIILQLNEQLMVISQSQAAKLTIEPGYFYSLQHIISQEGCDLIRASFAQNISQTFTDTIDDHPVTIKVVPRFPYVFLRIVFSEKNITTSVHFNQLAHYSDNLARNRISIILAALSNLKKQEDLPPYVLKHLAIIAHNAMRMLRTSSHTTLLYQPLHSFTSEFSSYDLNEVIQGICNNTIKVLPADLATITCKLLPDPLFVAFDKEHLSMAILNLISNSILHNKEGVCVTVSVSVHKKQVCITVSDDGIGFSPENFAMATPPLLVETPSLKNEMGLALANRIMANHYGTLFMANNDNGGAMVKLTFPSTLPSNLDFCSPEHFQSSPSWLTDIELSIILDTAYYEK